MIILLACASAFVCVADVRAQSDPKPIAPTYPTTPPPERRSPPPVLPPMQPDPNADPKLLDGFWPTDHMIELFVKIDAQMRSMIRSGFFSEGRLSS